MLIILVLINDQKFLSSASVLFQSIMKESYDHHAAIYFLLLDKLREQRTSPAASLAR